MKSKETLFKLRQNTEKAKIFADQIEKQAKGKLEFIKRRQELEETETFNIVAEAKEMEILTVLNLNLTQYTKLRSMNRKPSISISQNLRPSTSFIILKSSSDQVQRNIFEKKPTCPDSPNVLI